MAEMYEAERLSPAFSTTSENGPLLNQSSRDPPRNLCSCQASTDSAGQQIQNIWGPGRNTSAPRQKEGHGKRIRVGGGGARDSCYHCCGYYDVSSPRRLRRRTRSHTRFFQIITYCPLRQHLPSSREPFRTLSRDQILLPGEEGATAFRTRGRPFLAAAFVQPRRPRNNVRARRHAESSKLASTQQLLHPSSASPGVVISSSTTHPDRAAAGAMDRSKAARRRRSSSLVYQEPPESMEQLSDQSALPNLNSQWVNAKGILSCYSYDATSD